MCGPPAAKFLKSCSPQEVSLHELKGAVEDVTVSIESCGAVTEVMEQSTRQTRAQFT